jgi:hypothetical protein
LHILVNKMHVLQFLLHTNTWQLIIVIVITIITISNELNYFDLISTKIISIVRQL